MDVEVTSNSVVALVGFASVVALLLFLISRAQWHVFTALLVPILLLGFAPTIDRSAFVEAFEYGFGQTIQAIAVVIVLGTLIAEALRATGAVERITQSMFRVFGKKHVPLALTFAGFIIGLAVFSDVGYVILNPLVHVAAVEARASMALMATGLVGALQLTHAIVPPTPGPLAAAAIVEADLGKVIIYGTLVTLFGSFMGWVFAKMIGRRVYVAPSEDYSRSDVNAAQRKLPPLGWSYAPILVPIALIGVGSIADFALEEGSALHGNLTFLGWPVLALGVGVVIAYILTWRTKSVESTEELRNGWIENALRASAMIILVTGLGGSLSQLLSATPAVDIIAEGTLDMGLPAILLPFILGVMANMITGSTTVAVITAASLVAPMLGGLGLSAEAAMLSGACGSIIIKYVNASYFWVCTSLSGMPVRKALICYGGVTLVGGVFSMVGVVALWSLGAI